MHPSHHGHPLISGCPGELAVARELCGAGLDHIRVFPENPEPAVQSELK